MRQSGALIRKTTPRLVQSMRIAELLYVNVHGPCIRERNATSVTACTEVASLVFTLLPAIPGEAKHTARSSSTRRKPCMAALN
ncbi:MAG: hypothetical protein IPJ49_22575 [Candidatus Obscuribacter sp.]|nr:hypothetical protein [Candidatus Obscuribacter sp.]